MASSDFSALVLVNLAAGRGKAYAYLSRMRHLFQTLHFSAQFIETRSANDLEFAARQALAEGHRLLLAMGGDGTFQALANGAFGSDAIIGILPTGGGNDFAAALGLPRNPLHAVEKVVKGKTRFVDLVRVRTADGRTRLFVGGGGVGLDAEAALRASGPYRRLPGRFRYIASALHELWEHVPLHVRLEFPGTDVPPVESTCLLAAVLNTPTYGGGVRLAPDAHIDDGLLSVVLIGDMEIVRVLKLLPRLIGSGELRTSRVQRWKVRGVKICTDAPRLFHGDGEVLGSTPVEIEVMSRAVKVLAP